MRVWLRGASAIRNEQALSSLESEAIVHENVYGVDNQRHRGRRGGGGGIHRLAMSVSICQEKIQRGEKRERKEGNSPLFPSPP